MAGVCPEFRAGHVSYASDATRQLGCLDCLPGTLRQLRSNVACEQVRVRSRRYRACRGCECRRKFRQDGRSRAHSEAARSRMERTSRCAATLVTADEADAGARWARVRRVVNFSNFRPPLTDQCRQAERDHSHSPTACGRGTTCSLGNRERNRDCRSVALPIAGLRVPQVALKVGNWENK